MLIPLTEFALSCPQFWYLNKPSTECLQILLIDFVSENVHQYHDHSNHPQLDQILRSNKLILSQKMSRPSSAPGSPVVAGRQTAAVGRGVRSRFFHFFKLISSVRGKFQFFNFRIFIFSTRGEIHFIYLYLIIWVVLQFIIFWGVYGPDKQFDQF